VAGGYRQCGSTALAFASAMHARVGKRAVAALLERETVRQRILEITFGDCRAGNCAGVASVLISIIFNQKLPTHRNAHARPADSFLASLRC